jgi:hypothetical protein
MIAGAPLDDQRYHFRLQEAYFGAQRGDSQADSGPDVRTSICSAFRLDVVVHKECNKRDAERRRDPIRKKKPVSPRLFNSLEAANSGLEG